MTAGQLRVRLLGEFELRAGDEVVGPIASARARSLLGYLIVHAGVAHGRQRLAYLLWPDSTDSQSRTNLRNVLHVLRQVGPAIEPFLDVTSTTLSWRTDPACSVDVEEFLTLIEHAERAPGTGGMRVTDETEAPGGAAAGPSVRLEALQSAVAIYGGDLLEGCYDDWVIDARARVRDRFLSALRMLTESYVQRGDHANAIRVGRELVRRDPLDESSYRLLMHAHDVSADRAGAMRVYHECATVLQRELGVTPSAATSNEYAALTLDAGPRVAPVPALASESALVGRSAEWQMLTSCWRAAEEDGARLVLVTGEPGIGKTRLADELVTWCRRQGAIVARARSYAVEGELGYGVVISWLRAPALADNVRLLPPGDRAELGRLLPELGQAPPPISPLPSGADESARLRLFDAVVRALTRSERPVLLMLDDAQWSDGLSLQVVHYLLRRAADAPVMVLATARREDLDPHHPLTAVDTALAAGGRTAEVRLDRLTRAETDALVHSLTGDALDLASADALYADTEGNPLFVVETLRARAEGIGDDRLSPRLHAVISSRVLQLSDTARELLGIAATIGRGFTAELLAMTSGIDELLLIRGLDELWRRGLVREHGVDAYDFSHGRIREVAYDGLSPAVRRRNHVRVAEALIALHAEADAVSDQVAVNFDRAGHVDVAIAWYQRAARQAQRQSADAEAVRLLERARALIATRPEEAGGHRELSILSMLSTALVVVDSYTSERHIEIHRRALDVATRFGVDLDPTMLRSLVMANLCRNEFDQARADAEQLARAALANGDDGLAVESEYLLGIAAFWACDLRSARSHFERATELFRADQRSDHVLRFGHDPAVVCLSRLANTLWFLGETEGARATRDEALALAHLSHLRPACQSCR